MLLLLVLALVIFVVDLFQALKVTKPVSDVIYTGWQVLAVSYV